MNNSNNMRKPVANPLGGRPAPVGGGNNPLLPPLPFPSGGTMRPSTATPPLPPLPTNHEPEPVEEEYVSIVDQELARAEAEGSIGTVIQLESRVFAATEARKRLTNEEEVDELSINDNRRISRDYLEKVLENEEPSLTSSYDSLNLEQYIDFHNPNNNVTIPSNLTELRAAVKNIRGEKNNGVRIVTINSKNLGDSDIINVHGPKDGRPLVIHIFNDLPRLNIRSGKVIVQANSRSGHSVEVHNGAEAIVLGGMRSKIHTRTHAGGRTALVPGEGGWGLQTGEGDVTIAPSAFEHSYDRHSN